ncbi:MAG: hypothetical protein MK104_03350 [Erythrobacter sp.]|nr:hypothetical protein [Erythrobacter sp.]
MQAVNERLWVVSSRLGFVALGQSSDGRLWSDATTAGKVCNWGGTRSFGYTLFETLDCGPTDAHRLGDMCKRMACVAHYDDIILLLLIKSAGPAELLALARNFGEGKIEQSQTVMRVPRRQGKLETAGPHHHFESKK